MSGRAIGWLVSLGAAVVGFSTAAYTVSETEQVIVTQFGEIVGAPVTQAGLHFKVPFTQDLWSFDKRWLEWDGAANQVPTRDKKYIFVDTYARWRIKDSVVFFKTMRDELGAQSRLDDIIDGATRNVIASYDLYEVVRSTSRAFEAEEEHTQDAETARPVSAGRDTIQRAILAKAAAVAPLYGIELVDVRIKRVNYVESVQAKVFERMISERRQIAERHRSEGQGRSAEIRGKREREIKTIQSDAYRRAQEVMGKADAEAAAIYAAAYNKDADLYRFVKTMETYRTTVDDKTWLVLSTSGELLKYLTSSRP
jgi:membrane protease subunit HflC